MNKDNILKYLLMVQVCDSTFPIGTFNHSYGMETYLRENKINNSQDFFDWLKAYLNTQFYYSEGLLLKACYEKLPQNIDEVWNLDSLITHSTQSRETRDGTRMVANQMISLIQLLYPIDLLDKYKYRIDNNLSHGNPAIVFAIFAQKNGFSFDEAFCFYGYSVISTLIQNAVRAIPLGQKDGQIILLESYSILKEMLTNIHNTDIDDLGATVPGIELAQIRHEIQIFRLFMS
ncbi:hypothetical protein UA3_02488 [Enterococcus faecium EnGen0263]|nr:MULTISPECIES: urease accessory protein UreF [Enterococcus]EOH52798.1 hypothetical protein UA3_02488 [Enterococcus faecium EnGen0263]EJC3746347.1 urease accessory protein UreF [Enterococcus faecium]EME7220739.1 urease accessory protein UreF [Enterococcus faecium]EME8125021.1 urease accessory protein UreF [Enterococcus faecium]OQO64234.1 urease accessory protein UreF [Enterococcus faecium]